VTTPFSYEGRKRQLQAEEGIKNLKNYVDTLLVISNDKLRHQFGNLKMREAFAKADNVLATAAKCITDVINSTGQINVDFADVCTVMKNGGVAILGNAACDGEGRAQRAIEEALNSPLLNDNEIRGAKWILININSSEGEHEFTMDEVDIIQNYLLSQAGEHTDVILGLGYDNALGAKLGITLIATGFEHKDPFTQSAPKAQAAPAPREEKIVLTLGEQPKAKVPEAPAPVVAVDPLAPQLVEEGTQAPAEPGLTFVQTLREETPAADEEGPVLLQLKLKDEEAERERERLELEAQKRQLDDKFEQLRQNIIGSAPESAAPNAIPPSAAAGGYLARPSNIYAESNPDVSTPTSAGKPVAGPIASNEEEETFQMQLVIRNDQATDVAVPQQAQTPNNKPVEDPAPQDMAGEEKRRQAERLQKLRNLSFNMHSADPNNEFEQVPAYIRRNMELQSNQSSVENFYSNYTVQPDGKNGAQISTINTFLDGKKPD
ncbi:MAG: cell division protein FtsZ, partial [Chitinophagaceae bacterium]